MSLTGLAIIYIIIWWVVFFTILPIDVNRQKTIEIEGEDPGSPENPARHLQSEIAVEPKEESELRGHA